MIKDENMEEVLAEFKQDLSDYSELYTEQYDFSQDQLELFSGNQWDPKIVSARRTENRPFVTINKVRQYVNRIVNPLRKNHISPDIELEDEQQTEIVMGKIRDIDKQSRSKEAFECAFESQVGGGIGFVCVGTDYKNSDDLEQEVFIKKVDSFSQCYLGYHEEIDGSDARSGSYIKYTMEDEAIENWGKEVVKKAVGNLDVYSSWRGNIPAKSVVDATFYKMSERSHWRYFLLNGDTLDEIPEGVTKEEFFSATDEQGNAIVVNKRKVSTTEVNCYRIVGNTVVEHQVLPISGIPIIPAYGNKLYMDRTDKRKWAGVPYDLKDNQEIFNYYKSNELELVSKAPKTPFIGVVGQFATNREDWENLNTSSKPFIEADVVTVNGNPAPLPQRMDNQAYTGGLAQSMLQTSQEMGEQAGVSRGMMGEMQGANEASGAVFQRNTQGELNTIQFSDNLEQTAMQTYKIVLELLAYVGDTEQTHALTDSKGVRTFEKVNFAEILTKKTLRNASISIKGGPMRESQRRADTQGVLEVIQLFPNKIEENFDTLMPIMIDMLGVENGEAFKKALGGGEDAPDPQAMQALQEADATIQELEGGIGQLEEHIKELNNYIIAQEEERKKDLIEKQMDSETKLTIAEMNNDTKLEVEYLKQAGSAESQDKDLAQKGRENVMKMVNDTINENNVILERELTENDNIGMPAIVTSAPSVEIEVSE